MVLMWGTEACDDSWQPAFTATPLTSLAEGRHVYSSQPGCQRRGMSGSDGVHGFLFRELGC